MKNKHQADLFEWADSRPSAEIVNLQDVATRIMIEKAARGDYDEGRHHRQRDAAFDVLGVYQAYGWCHCIDAASAI